MRTKRCGNTCIANLLTNSSFDSVICFWVFAIAVVFVKAYRYIIYLHDAMIADGYLMCIAAGYSITCCGPPKGRLAYTTHCFANRLSLSDLSSIPLLRNCCTYFALNTFAQCLYGEQIFVATPLSLPAAFIIYATTGHNAVQVRM